MASLSVFNWPQPAETEIHRERRTIASWKVFARPESFALNILCLLYPKLLWKITEVSGKFLDRLESFQIVLNVSELSGKFCF